MKHATHGSSSKPKITKEERRAKYTELARRRATKERERAAGRTSICFQCRRKGHTVANCPNGGGREDGAAAVVVATVGARCCYKCGSTEHSLSSCPKRRRVDNNNDLAAHEELPFATCFVCKEVGHLASQCPQNSNGIYIHGGCCKVCGSNQHRGTECPEKKARTTKAAKLGTEEGSDGVESDGVFFDDLLDEPRPATGVARNPEAPTNGAAAGGSTAKRKRRVVNF